MAKNNNLTDFLTDVADAIRVKRDKTDLINPQDFHDEILAIETGSSGPIIEGNGEYEVVFIDFDGTELKKQYVNEGESATPPTPPEHEYLTFNQWVGDYTNIRCGTVIGAHYTNNDGKIRAYCHGGYTTIDIVITNTSCTIDWGDGTTTELPSYTTTRIEHKYSDYAGYWITIDVVSTSGISSIKFGYNIKGIIEGPYGGFSGIDIDWVVLRSRSVMEYTYSAGGMIKCLIIPPTINSFIIGSYRGGYSRLKYIVLQNSDTDVKCPSSDNSFNSVRLVSMGFSGTTKMNLFDHLEDYLVFQLYSLYFHKNNFHHLVLDYTGKNTIDGYNSSSSISVQDLVIRDPVTSVALTINIIQVKRVIIRANTPMPLSGTFYEASKMFIYVPDASVQAYKTATGWSAYAARIKGISEMI